MYVNLICNDAGELYVEFEPDAEYSAHVDWLDSLYCPAHPHARPDFNGFCTDCQVEMLEQEAWE